MTLTTLTLLPLRTPKHVQLHQDPYGQGWEGSVLQLESVVIAVVGVVVEVEVLDGVGVGAVDPDHSSQTVPGRLGGHLHVDQV